MSRPRIVFKKRGFTKRIILHDSHTTPDVGTMEEVPRWAALARRGALEMGLVDTGYHFIIERNGKVIETRDRREIGSHTPGHNMDSIGICLVGGRERWTDEGVDNFTKPQWESLYSLVGELRDPVRDLQLYAHTEVQRYRNKRLPKCPPVDMDDVRQELALMEAEERMKTYGRS